jgi:hypothetical protein
MRPWCDEGWFSNPAENLATTSSMPTSVLDPTSTWRGVNLQGINRHTYWIMPLYILAQAGWYRIAGFSMVSMRLSSVLWGLVALLSWYIILKRLSGSTAVALLAVALLGTDFQFLSTAGPHGHDDGRAGERRAGRLPEYAQTQPRPRILVSQTLAAAGVFTHPLGLLGAVGMVFVSVYYDWKTLRFRHIVLTGILYAAGVAG